MSVKKQNMIIQGLNAWFLKTFFFYEPYEVCREKRKDLN